MNDLTKPYEVIFTKPTFTAAHPQALDNRSDAEINDHYYDLAVRQEEAQHMALEAGNGVPRALGSITYIGFDCEWVEMPEPDTDGGGHQSLKVLSYQLSVVGIGGEMGAIFLPQNGIRLTLKEILGVLLQEALKIGLIDGLPKDLILIGFFLRADLAMLDDLVEFRTELDNVGGKVATVTKPVELEISTKSYQRMESNRSVIPEMDNQMPPALISVHFIDMAKHAPEGTRLSALGDSLKLPKLTLPDGYDISRMDQLLAGDREAFLAYGLRDAEIPVLYYLEVLKLASEILNDRASRDGFLPPSAGAMAVKLCIKTMESDDIAYEDAFAITELQKTHWNREKGKVRTIKVCQKSLNRSFHESFATQCYHGGRNETYEVGPSGSGLWNDYDLTGAYTTALLGIREIDYASSRESNCLDDYQAETLGFACVEFEFPVGTRFPCLPVKTQERGLWFPLQGESYCTAPELLLARSMGAIIKIKRGVIYDWKAPAKPLFKGFTTRVRELRKRHPKGSVPEQYAKLIGNSLYGKTGQGLKDKTAFDTSSLTSKKIPESKVSNAAIAAWVTGFVRAVMGELLARIPDHRTVISCTTDGFLTNATEAEIDLSGSLATLFQCLLHEIDPAAHMLEIKHQVKRVLSIKTRGAATLELGDHPKYAPVVLAKSSVSPPADCQDRNQYMVDLYLNRQPGDKGKTKPFVSVRSQWLNLSDVYRLESEVTLNLEYDFKRKPVNLRSEVVGEREHIAFSSEPWLTCEEGELTRTIFDGWREENNLKTLTDFDRWQVYLATHRAVKKKRQKQQSGNMNVMADGALGLLRRAFLRAYTRGLWGLDKGIMSYSELAQYLSSIGVETGVNDVKNASRGNQPPQDHIVPRLDAVMNIVAALQAKFITFDAEQMLVDASEVT